MKKANFTIKKQSIQDIKCSRCAELSGCYKGQHGGKKNCKCFCPTA